MLIRFDDTANWVDALTEALRGIVPSEMMARLATAKPAYVEDAQSILLDGSERRDVAAVVLKWLEANELAAYHGTRLGADEVASIRSRGLVPFEAADHAERLTRALSKHPLWRTVKTRLDAELRRHGPEMCSGDREGQVHLTLSKAALLNGFPHYLTHGSEFQQEVAEELLGSEGLELLAADGEPQVVEVKVPGIQAAEIAAEDLDFFIDRGDLPTLISAFLTVWAYRQSRPEFCGSSLHLDCGLCFRSAVPSSWIVSIERVAGA